jgi:hypothetical protein
MAKSKTKGKRTPKHALKLPDFEQSKSAVMNSLTSRISQRTYVIAHTSLAIEQVPAG